MYWKIILGIVIIKEFTLKRTRIKHGCRTYPQRWPVRRYRILSCVYHVSYQVLHLSYRESRSSGFSFIVYQVLHLSSFLFNVYNVLRVWKNQRYPISSSDYRVIEYGWFLVVVRFCALYSLTSSKLTII